MGAFRQLLASGHRIIFDGAMGTMLQKFGLPPGQSPEEFCLARPEILQSVHEQYLDAGANVLTTNTFGGTRYKLPAHLQVADFNTRMAEAARRAVTAKGCPAFVAGSIGPTGKFLTPLGELDFAQMVEAFREQVRGLLRGGVDLFIIETHYDIAEARAAVVAIRRECALPVIASMTYEDGRTLTGSSVAVCVSSLANMGVDAVGMNCSAGPVEMRGAVEELLRESPVPVIVQPNAGLPELRDGETVFPLDPDQFASLTASLAAPKEGLGGVQIAGGCCGTSPAHIAALRQAFASLPPVGKRPCFAGITVSSRQEIVRFGFGSPVGIIGERINPTGKKVLAAQLQAGEYTEALRFAEEQIAHGAVVLDVNVGAPMVDEASILPALVARLHSGFSTPLALDSPNPEALARALEVYPASPLVNSISGEEGRLERLGPLCKEFGAPFVLLPLKGRNLPEKSADRIKIIEEILERMDDLGIPRRLAMVDILALSVSSTPSAALECLEVIRYCREVAGLPTTCGLSNISFGLPARELVNSTFFAAAAGAGLASCIANPQSRRIREVLDSANLLLGHDTGAERFVSGYAGWQSGGPAGAISQGSGPGAGGNVAVGGTASAGAASLSLEDAVILGRKDNMAALVQAALDAGQEPFAIVGDRLIPAITEVGLKYEKKEYFLPQLIRSAEAMKGAFALLQPLLDKANTGGDRPVVVLATVEGDIHDIGKNIVALMLGNHGFDVRDLGKDVKAEAIVAAVREFKASLVGLSALMTTTMVRMEDTVRLLRQENLDTGVIVGGAVVTDAFAQSINAHYAKDAVDAVRVAKRLLQ